MKVAETILGSLSQPLLLLDPSLCAVLANPAFYSALGIGVGELEGKTVQKLISVEREQFQLVPILEKIVTGSGEVEDFELPCIISPNIRKIFSVTARRLPGIEGESVMLLVELRDITRQKDSELKVQELRDAQQKYRLELEGTNTELEAFSHSVSHDLRAPLRLTNKIGHLLLQAHGGALPAGAIEKIHMILDSTEEMGKLIEDLLTFSHANRSPMTKRRIDLQQVMREALSELEDTHEDRDVKVHIGDLPSCLADRALMKQVCLNLLSNAFKFNRAKVRTEIWVDCTETGDETIYSVRDNGIGFDTATSGAMFVAFHRLQNAHSFEGSGIGLALVKRIVDRHAGRIWAEGVPNEGATIYFSLGPSNSA